jgi:hypothetical protein
MWRVAEALEYGIVGINEGIISIEIAPFGGMKESGIGPSGGLLGLKIRHRGIPRSQIPLHGRHRPVCKDGRRDRPPDRAAFELGAPGFLVCGRGATLRSSKRSSWPAACKVR